MGACKDTPQFTQNCHLAQSVGETLSSFSSLPLPFTLCFPVILWIELGDKPKWLPLISGYHDKMCTAPFAKSNLFLLIEQNAVRAQLQMPCWWLQCIFCTFSSHCIYHTAAFFFFSSCRAAFSVQYRHLGKAGGLALTNKSYNYIM